MLRILHIVTKSWHAHTFVLPAAEYLRSCGYTVEFACSYRSFADAPSRVEALQAAGFVVHEVPFVREIEPLRDLRSLLRLVALIRRGNYDLVHTHQTKAGLVGRLAAKIAGTPVIIHTVDGFHYQSFAPGLRQQFSLLLERLGAACCDQMLLVTEALRQAAITHRLKPASALTTVGQGINFVNFTDMAGIDASALRRQFGLDANAICIGSVGRLMPQKGMDILIRAAALVIAQEPNVHLLIGGTGPLQAELEALAHTLQISDHVHFAGYLQKDEVKQLMSALDLFVLATRYEGLGVVYLEAMALACPVIGTRIAPVDEVIVEGKTGLLAEKENPEDFANAMLRLIANPDLRKTLGTAGPTYVRQQYDLAEVFMRIEAVYRGALVNQPSYG